jgi:hypothetical protein
VPYGSVDELFYKVAVDLFVEKWGLDRLQGSRDDAFTTGWTYVNEWCMIRQLYPDSTPASEFSVSTGWVIPDVILDTAVTVEIAEAWDPERERQRDAQRRLERLASKAIRARLESIASDAELNGLTFPDTASERNRDLDWVFQLCRYRKTIVQIAGELQESEPDESKDRDWEITVSKAVARMADRLHIRTAGWYVTGRTSRPDR